MRAYMSWRKSSISQGSGSSCVEVAWRKSSFSEGAGTDCVEVALAVDGVGVRDSKNVSGPILAMSAATWRRFINTLP